MNDQIERIEAPTRQEFVRNYVDKNKPVILTGVTSRWDAFSKWTPDYLKSVAGHVTVPVHYNEEASFTDWYVDRPNRVVQDMKFGDLVDRLSNGDTGRQYYLTECDLPLVSDALIRDLDFATYIGHDPAPYVPMIFMGRDTCMPNHYHGTQEAFLCQLTGEKKIVLHSPDQYPFMYPGKWYKPVPLFSRIEGRRILAGDVDLDRYPKFKYARPLEFDLHPGEMLFIPVHWWHVTGVSGYQVSVTHFWKAKLKCWRFPTPGLACIGREISDFVKKAVGWGGSDNGKVPYYDK